MFGTVCSTRTWPKFRALVLNLVGKNLKKSLMEAVLPGESVQAEHVNLKLGPGLLHSFDASGKSSIVATRAGALKHSSNGSKWWVENNSRRVSEHNISEVDL